VEIVRGTFRADTTVVPATLQPEQGNVYRLDLRGVLRKRELDVCQAMLAAAIGELRVVRLLVVLEAFAGWEIGASWNDLSFYVQYGDAIERIAIVGDPRWRDLMLMFANVDLRRARVEFFPEHAAAEARAWLSQSLGETWRPRTRERNAR
jgi:hypothetical protein